MTRTKTTATKPRVLNKYRDAIPADAFYGGRGGPLGNPFVIGRDGDRATVIAKHEVWFRDQHHLLRRLDEFRGRDGVCFCAPLAPGSDRPTGQQLAGGADRVVAVRGDLALALAVLTGAGRSPIGALARGAHRTGGRPLGPAGLTRSPRDLAAVVWRRRSPAY